MSRVVNTAVPRMGESFEEALQTREPRLKMNPLISTPIRCNAGNRTIATQTFSLSSEKSAGS